MRENWFQREFIVRRRLAFNILFYGTHLALFAYGWHSQVSQLDYLLSKSKSCHSRQLMCAWPYSTPSWDSPSGFLVALVSLLPLMAALSLSQCCATSFESSVPSLHACSPRMKTFGFTDRSPTRWLSGQ